LSKATVVDGQEYVLLTINKSTRMVRLYSSITRVSDA